MTVIRALLVEDNPGDVGLIRAILLDSVSPQIELTPVPRLGEAIALLERQPFEIVLLDLNLPDSRGLNTVTRMTQAAGDLPIIVLTGLDDESMAISAVEEGAQDYLVKGDFDAPRLVRTIRYSIARTRAQAAKNQPALQGAVLGFLGAKGGCGITTLLCHVAQELGFLAHQRVLLVDLDLHCGMLSFYLKAVSGYSILQAAEDVTRLDASFLKAITVKAGTHLDLIGAPQGVPAGAVPADAVRQVVGFLRGQYEWVLLDLGPALSPLAYSVLGECDELFVVSTPNILSLYRTKLVVEGLTASTFPRESLRLVLNRMPKRPEIGLEDFHRILGLRAFSVISDREMDLHDFRSEGRMVARSSDLGKQFTLFSQRLLEDRDTLRRAATVAG